MYFRIRYVLTDPCVPVMPCPCVHVRIMDKATLRWYQLIRVLSVSFIT